MERIKNRILTEDAKSVVTLDAYQLRKRIASMVVEKNNPEADVSFLDIRIANARRQLRKRQGE